MITFNQARAMVARKTGVPSESYGYENDDVYQVFTDWGGVIPPFDEPDRLVNKRTGKITEIVGLLGNPPAPNLRPINNPPE